MNYNAGWEEGWLVKQNLLIRNDFDTPRNGPSGVLAVTR